ncbi:MAG: hypothetical protein ACK5QX_01575 [bacterium]
MFAITRANRSTDVHVYINTIQNRVAIQRLAENRDQRLHANPLTPQPGNAALGLNHEYMAQPGGLRRPLRGAGRKKPGKQTAKNPQAQRNTRPCGQPSCPHHKGVDSRLRRFLG